MSKIIHVPQGYSARLTREQMLQHDISGLFTDSFSSCNILAAISIDKLILMHIDANMLGAVKMLAQMQREIEWIDGAREIIVAFRNVDNGGGRNINKDLLAYFALDMPLVRIVEKEIDNDTHGICLSFGTQKPSDIHLNIEKFPFLVRPEGLIHHPQERQFLAVQKMEQVIGKEEQRLSGLTKNKQFCLFNGGWEILGKAELKVDTTHPITRAEMQLFTKDDVHIEILQLLKMLMNSSVVPSNGDKDMAAIFMAPYFEDYLNNYNYVLLFKRNLKYMVNMERYKPQSNADRDFKQAIIRLTAKPEDIFDELKKMVDEYKAQALESEFKEMMLDGYETFTSHYKDRKYYDDLKRTYIQMLEKATNYNKEGIYNYKEKNYQLAASSFLEAIKLYTYGCVKSEPNLASTYYNYGQSLGKVGDYRGAAIFIKIALELRQNYTIPKTSQQVLEKTRAALNTYEKKLEEQSFGVRALVKALDINQDNKPTCDSTNNPVNEDRKLYNEGMQFYRAGNYAAALNCFQQELINQKKTEIILPNIETAILNFNIGSVYLKMQNPMSALVYLQTAFDVRCQLLGADDEATVKTKTRLEECQAAINSISQTLIFSVPKPEAVAPDLTLNSEPVINRFRINKE